ncbi:efflux transporter outer membrane subunit [Altererythrobacter sp. Z27]|uniref:efflux transporter outer membrane subunit n=1 Tax=Altererythrobacter sp. Z27 TaxID=3461147 RepID=UPI00404513CD
MRLPAALTAAAPLALAACVAGPPPDIATPAPELPETYLYTPDAAAQAGLAALLPAEDPAFAALSARALAEGPTLAEALARVDAARAAARGAGAARLPSIGANASITASRTNPAQFGTGLPAGIAIDSERTAYSANLTGSWEIDLFGRLKASERAALARVDSAGASAEAVRIALLAEIAGAVIDWRSNAAREAALAQDLAAAERLAQLAAKREEAGLAPGFDRVRAEAAASQSRSRLAALQGERAQIVGRLVALTGQDANAIVALLSAQAALSEQPLAPAAMPSELLVQRPDVRAAAADLAAADADLAAAARARFPRLTLSAALGLLAFDLGKLFDSGSDVYSVSGGIAAPLLDFGRIEAQIDGAAAGKRAAFAAYRGAVFNALGETEAAYGVVAGADAQSEAAARESADLERAASLAETRYRAGLADFLTVLEARRAADASGERAAAALGQARLARVRLWLALGSDAQAMTRSTTQ